MNEENRNRDKGLKSGERITKKTEFLGRPSTRYRMASTQIKAGDVVVDVGCGAGYGSELLNELCGCAVVGIDDSSEVIEFAKENCKTVAFVCADIGDEKFIPTDIIDKQCTVVVACEILEHFPCPEVVMDNILKLNPVKVIGTVPEVTAQHVDKWHYQEFKLEDLEKLFHGIGYKIFEHKIVEFTRGNAIYFIAEKNI